LAAETNEAIALTHCFHKENQMKLFSILAMVFALLLSGVATDADAARRIGGGKTSGMQRSNVTQPNQAAPQAPAGQSAQKNQADAPATGTPAQAAAPAKRSWMGPIAGLAAGLGLAALASHFGFGEELANMMMMALVVMVVLGVIGFIMRKRMAAQQPALAGAGAGAQFAGLGQAQQRTAVASGGAGGVVGGISAGQAPAARVPAGFDVAALERQAKVQFIRLQAANDAGNLDDIREFTTPEMFAEVKMSLSERGGVAQQTDVLRVDAQVLDVTDEPARYVASVRFTGQIKDLQSQEVESFDEVWHLIQFHNIGVWQLAGIQQS
jgi:predicted lipid-binding transport protein (Tim44 family)